MHDAVELQLWDKMLAFALENKHKLPKSFPRAMLKEYLRNLDTGSPSVAPHLWLPICGCRVLQPVYKCLIDLYDTRSRHGRIALAMCRVRACCENTGLRHWSFTA